MIKVVLIDDEENCLSSLAILLTEYCPEVQIMEQCQSVQAGLAAINAHKPDLIFLDIEMPVLNGFDLLEMIKNYPIAVIFTTAYQHYAVKAIRFSALDYLLKPIDVKEFKIALDQLEFDNLEPASVVTQKKMQLKIDKNQTVILNYDDIIYLLNSGNYTTFFLNNNIKYVISKNLGYFIDKLPEFQFFRCHQSYCINVNQVYSYKQCLMYYCIDSQ